MNKRSYSHQRFLSENLSNNYNEQIKYNYNIPNEEIKQSNFETNLINGVNENLNLLLSNLKTNKESQKIYYPLNSKIKSPMRIKPANNFPELNLVDAYNFILENNAKKNNDYFSQNDLSDFSYPLSYNNEIIIENPNNSNQINNNNKSNRKENLSYSGHELNNRNKNNSNTKTRIKNKYNIYERNNNLVRKNQNFSSNNINKLLRPENKDNSQ